MRHSGNDHIPKKSCQVVESYPSISFIDRIPKTLFQVLESYPSISFTDPSGPVMSKFTKNFIGCNCIGYTHYRFAWVCPVHSRVTVNEYTPRSSPLTSHATSL